MHVEVVYVPSEWWWDVDVAHVARNSGLYADLRYFSAIFLICSLSILPSPNRPKRKVTLTRVESNLVDATSWDFLEYADDGQQLG